MDKTRLTSSGILLILAVTAAGGIFLLDLFYLRPRARVQEWSALREQAGRAQSAAKLVLSSQQEGLRRVSRAALRSTEVVEMMLDKTDEPMTAAVVHQMLESAGADQAWLVDPHGSLSGFWTEGRGPTDSRPAEGGALAEAIAAVAPGDHRDSLIGFLKLPDGPVVFCRTRIGRDSRIAGHLWLVRGVGPDVLAKMGQAAGGEVVFVADGTIPRGEATEDISTCSTWRSGEDILARAWQVHDASGKPAGYFRVTLPISQANLQSSAGRRTVLIVLSLSIGLSLMVIMGAHMLVTGPAMRLLKKIQWLESGRGCIAELTRDLHGEPLLLARRLESAFDRLAEMSKIDQLTGLANRRHFEQVLAAFYNQARRYNRPLSVMVMDVDFFKAVNDTGGHASGDDVLRQVTRALEAACRKADLPARLGGDEFAVLLPETTAADAQAVAERISMGVSGLPISVGSARISITASIGVADLNSGEMDSPDALMALADRALYAAKERGRNRVVQARELTGVNWRQCGEAGDRVGLMCKKLAGLDNQFKELFLRAIEEMVVILEHRNHHMAAHTLKVEHYSILIGREMGLPDRVVKQLRIAAMLHDVGMIAMPDAVLLSPGSLSDKQQAFVRRHTLLSVQVMEGMEFLEQEIPAVRYHHERFDGKGYPEGISGAAIPLTARILAVADAFDAMTSSRTYRPAKNRQEACAEIEKGAGAQFDPSVVEAFLSVAARMGDGLMELPPRRGGQAEQPAPSAAVPDGNNVADPIPNDAG
ncbi:MAG: diguanylate cyclase [Phycisphaerae bacterium]